MSKNNNDVQAWSRFNLIDALKRCREALKNSAARFEELSYYSEDTSDIVEELNDVFEQLPKDPR